MRRRRFLRIGGAGAAGTLLLPGWARGVERPGARRLDENEVRIVVLHTNDTHSRIDPFPMDGGRFQGLGGVARRASLIEKVRAEEPNVLLLDSGDIFQGTPYFNFFKGELEFRAMSAMDYHVATIGNHDFDNGVGGLVEMMPHATFYFVSANYEVSGSPLEPFVRPWVIREVEGVKIGIFGLGIAFDGLVLASLHEGVEYADPYSAARKAVGELRREGCSLVICLSHMGYRYGGETPSDTLLAQRVEGIDLILGGHTHTFLDEPDVYDHPGGQRTVVNQVGWAGMRLGRVDVVLGPGGEDSPGDGKVPLPGDFPQAHEAPLTRDAPRPRRWEWTSYSVDASLD